MNIPAGIFKARCLHLMDEVQKYHKEIIITKFGKPVAMLVPVGAVKADSPFGFMKDSLSIKGDIVSSTGEEWVVDG